ncbi:unnamed protein product [Pylaiella littoralis]
MQEDRPQKDSSSGASNKQAKKSATKKQGDGSGVSNKIELGNKKFVDVREFKGMILIDIREYYEKDGEMKPTKKGIALSVDQWEAMKDNMDDITERRERERERERYKRGKVEARL